MSQSLSPLHQVSEALLQAASIGVTIADVRTNDMPLVYVNRGFEQMTGYMASEVIGKNCRFLQGAHTDQPALTNVREALSEGRSVTVVLKNHRKSGEVFFNQLHLYPSFDATGELTHYVGLQYDVTAIQASVHELEERNKALERTVQQRTEELQEFVGELQGELNIQRRLEAQLRDMNSALETKVEERTAELAVSLEKQKALGEIRARFVMTVSHEFRTPLSGIALAVGILKKFNDQFEKVERDEQLDNIREAVENLTKLLDEVMFISKADANKLEFSPKSVDVRSFCAGIINQIQRIDAGSHVFRLECATPTCEIVADEKLLRSALTNLISNAAKYSPAGSTVEITLTPSDDEVAIRVRDHGIGIPPDDVEALFEPFHRAANAQTIAGTGLGLVIVKNAVERHGGTVDVATQLNKGTTFTLTFPRRVDAALLDENNDDD
jgi:PAS domain S-box-containing protein